MPQSFHPGSLVGMLAHVCGHSDPYTLLVGNRLLLHNTVLLR